MVKRILYSDSLIHWSYIIGACETSHPWSYTEQGDAFQEASLQVFPGTTMSQVQPTVSRCLFFSAIALMVIVE